MKSMSRRDAIRLIPAAAGMMVLGRPRRGRAAPVPDLRARIVALGIPGASAISPVGTFLAGGPIHDNPAFADSTQSGRILDPARILVGSRSNFGAPLANAQQQAGSFLSLDLCFQAQP